MPHHDNLEILAPVGTEVMLHAAIENGADAVYFGVQNFNARIRAENFQISDLPQIMRLLHRRGVKGYLTFNTLVFNDELQSALDLLQACSKAGVDAIIVQDLGIAYLAQEITPELPVHASTQMTLSSAESILGATELGLNLQRIVVPRELSLKELKLLLRETDKEIEVFVHGALCVAYSGQCLTSEALGGRSANRGECAQACRLPYDLIVDGKKKDLENIKYLLSPKDLAAYDDLAELMRLGVKSIKIEGRLKSPEYVAASVKAYREALTNAKDKTKQKKSLISAETLEGLESTFSRGFTKGYLHEINHQAVVEGAYSGKRGTLIGSVLNVKNNRVEILAQSSIKCGDGVLFSNDSNQGREQGGKIYELFLGQSRLKNVKTTQDKKIRLSLTFENSKLDFRQIRAGDKIWKTSDSAIEARLRSSFTDKSLAHRRPVTARITGAPGTPLKLRIEDEQGNFAEVLDTEVAESAHSKPLTAETLSKYIGRLGDSPFCLEELYFDSNAPIIVPFSRLNELRRRAVNILLKQREEIGTLRFFDNRGIDQIRDEILNSNSPSEVKEESTISILCRNLAQVKAAISSDIRTVYTDFEDIRLHRQAREIIPEVGFKFIPATLRIVKPGEAPVVRKLLTSNPDGILIRNLASWQILKKQSSTLDFIGDYTLNVANDLTARLLIKKGFSLLTPSYDLNFEQLQLLIRNSESRWLEVTIHQYMPMFHMEHCVFCRFLSQGTDFTNCGRPCEKHEIKLSDRQGYAHPVKADFGCRNTVFNAVPQSAAEYLNGLKDLGIRNYRIDLLDESEEETIRIIDQYRSVLTKRVPPNALWKSLNAHSKLGVTRGSLDHAFPPPSPKLTSEKLHQIGRR